MTDQTGMEPDEARVRLTEDEDEPSVEGHVFRLGNAGDEPGLEDLRPRAAEDGDLSIGAEGARPK